MSHAPIDLEQLVRETAERMTKVAKQAYPPVQILECWMCQGFGRDEDGGICFHCGGRGRIATGGGEP
jgi:hypothetical protein